MATLILQHAHWVSASSPLANRRDPQAMIDLLRFRQTLSGGWVVLATLPKSLTKARAWPSRASVTKKHIIQKR